MKMNSLTPSLLYLLCTIICLAPLSGCENSTEALRFLAVASTTPADGENRVNVRPNIQIVLAAPIDETSLEDSSVLLVGFPSSELMIPVVPASLSYAALTKTITIQPSRPLEWALNYKLTVTGLRDADGMHLQPFQIQFQTFENRWIRHITNFPGDGFLCMFSFSGEKQQPQNYFEPGSDGICFTADDVIRDSRKDIYDRDGMKAQELTFGGPGPDSVWFTADDPLNLYTAFTYRDDGTPAGSISYVGAGPDGEWFSVDDLVGGWTNYVAYPNQSEITETEYRGQGNDGLWFTADDYANHSYVHSSDENKNVVKTVSYYGTFAPNKAVMQGYSLFTYDANGNRTRDIHFSREGEDGIWFTADDEGDLAHQTTYDENGMIRGFAYFFDKGEDGVWFTADDLPLSITTIDYNSQTNEWRHTSTRYSFGTKDIESRNLWRIQYSNDGRLLRFLNSDGPSASENPDSVRSYEDFIYDSAGNLTRTQGFKTPGADGQWFNSDDTLSGYGDYTYAANGNRLSNINYDHPGADGVWFTADDHVNARNDFDAEN